MKQIRWNLSKRDDELVNAIVDRIIRLRKKAGLPAVDRQDTHMDITACHLNGTALDLLKFLSFDDANFGHDAFGISRYIDRTTGTLTDFFVPRCSAPKKNRRGRTSRADARLTGPVATASRPG